MNLSETVLSVQGYPLKLYHGTCAEFKYFRPLSHFGTKNAAKMILQGKRDAETREEDPISLIMKEDEIFFGGIENDAPASKDKIIPVYLRMKHPFMLADLPSHSAHWYKTGLFYGLLSDEWHTDVPLNRARELFTKSKGSLKDESAFQFFAQICNMADFLPQLQFIFDEPFALPIEQVRYELSLEKLYHPCADGSQQVSQKTDRYHLVFQRMIRFFESLGYDGFVYQNEVEDQGSFSYIIFRPDQVKRLDYELLHVPDCRPSALNEALLNAIMQETLKCKKTQPLEEDEIVCQSLFQADVQETKRFFAMKPDFEDSKMFWMKFGLHYVVPQVMDFARQKNYRLKVREVCQSILLGIDCAVSNHVNPLPVILCCALYDYTQISDDKEKENLYPNYGFARGFLLQQNFNLTPSERRQIAQILTRFSDETAKQNSVYACAHDAICVWKKWKGLTEQNACITRTGQWLADCSVSEKETYLKAQQQDLATLNIASLLQLPKYYQYRRFLNVHERA